MSSPVLHIKDSFYFEIPKALLPCEYKDKKDFPALWVKNDDQYQAWEAEHVYEAIAKQNITGLPEKSHLIEHWQHWQHAGKNHENFAVPFDEYLERQAAQLNAGYTQKVAALAKSKSAKVPTFNEYVASLKGDMAEFGWFAVWHKNPKNEAAWKEIKVQSGSDEAIAKFQKEPGVSWSQEKLAHYNSHCFIHNPLENCVISTKLKKGFAFPSL
jgi:F-type H+-transporting ATPase subunit a